MTRRPLLMRRHFSSLRFRLSAINFALTAVILFVVCGTVLLARSRELHGDLDERLVERAELILDAFLRDSAIDPERVPSLRQLGSGYWVQIRGADGKTVYRSSNLGEGELPRATQGTANSQQACETISATAVDSNLVELREMRMCSTVTADEGGRLCHIQVARSLEPVQHMVRILRNAMLTVIVFGLAVAAVASWFVIGRMLSPLQSIAQRADRLSLTSIGERLGGEGRDEVSKMAASLDAMLDRLRESFRAQERFLSAVSHELKTPLSVLLGQAQVLARQSREADEYERFVAAVQDEVRSLARTVESLLMLARAEAGIPLSSKSQVSMNEAVIDAVSRCAPMADQREVRLVPSLAMPTNTRGEPVVEGDGEMLRIMVSNLVRNAVRYAPPDSAVEVQVLARDGYVAVSVRDHGPGIPSEYLGHVFDRFFQVPKDNESFQGVGLGLTITRSVAELHAGSVSVLNHPDGGCEFQVCIPLASR